MVGRKRTPPAPEPDPDPRPGRVDLNEIVAYNFRAARELRGWTQEETAEALESLLGQRLPQASISAIERAYVGDRRREFDAQEILAFALAFDLPMVWFFLPPPHDHRGISRTTNTVNELYGLVFGRPDQLEPVYDRLRQIGVDDPSETARTVETLLGTPSPARLTSYRERRKQMLLALLDEYADGVDQAAEEIGGFFDRLRQIGVRGLVAEQLQDGEYIGLPPEPEAPTEDEKPARKGRR